MNTFAEVGVLYVYIMLILLVLGLGYLGFRLLENVLKWFSKDNELKNKKTTNGQDQPWIRLVFLSATFLFLLIFSQGVLKTIGAGEEQHDHNHTGAAGVSTIPIQNNSQVNNFYMQQQLQNQINQLSNQINMMERLYYNY